MGETISGRTPVLTPFVVHGSFKKHLGDIQSAVQMLNETGQAKAIAPHNCTAVDEQDGFTLLEGEQNKDPQQIETEYLQKVLSLKALGGFSLWVTPGGYIGKSAAYEYGIAQACGVPAFFTEMPEDVPFYVRPSAVRTPAQLAEQLIAKVPISRKFDKANTAIGEAWERLSFPTANVAVGGIVTYHRRMLLVEDGRWPDGQLTVPGTTVRSLETRDAALSRMATDKFGFAIKSAAKFQTSFMLGGSGFAKPMQTLVFDDRVIELSSERLQPKTFNYHWLNYEEARDAVEVGQVEPNAAGLIDHYLAVA